jgi:hypothetical protein
MRDASGVAALEGSRDKAAAAWETRKERRRLGFL